MCVEYLKVDGGIGSNRDGNIGVGTSPKWEAKGRERGYSRRPIVQDGGVDGLDGVVASHRPFLRYRAVSSRINYDET